MTDPGRVVRAPLARVPLRAADGTAAGCLLVGPAGHVLALEQPDGRLAWPEGHEPLRLVLGEDARLRACGPDGSALAVLGLAGRDAVEALRSAGAVIDDRRRPPPA